MDVLMDPSTWRIVLEVAGVAGLALGGAQYKTLYKIIVAIAEAVEQQDVSEGIKKDIKRKVQHVGAKKKLDKILLKNISK